MVRGAGTGWGRDAHRVGTFEHPEEHARVGCGDAEGFVEERGEVVFCLGFFHCVGWVVGEARSYTVKMMKGTVGGCRAEYFGVGMRLSLGFRREGFRRESLIR